MEYRSEIRDGMCIDWNVPIEIDDGLILRADVFRPIPDGKYPVVLSMVLTRKALPFRMAIRTSGSS